MSLETRARIAAEGLRATISVDTEAGLIRLRRTHRRRNASRVAAAGLGVAATIVAGAALVGDQDAAEPAPRPPSSTSSPSPTPNGPQVVVIPDVRRQQILVEPEITSDLTPGERRLESASTSDWGYDEDGSIELSVGDTGRRQLRVEGTCAGAPDAWFVMLYDNGNSLHTGRCDGATIMVNGAMYDEELAGVTVSMIVTAENPREFRQCFDEGCEYDGRPLRDSGATMSLSTYEWIPGPTAFRMFGRALPARENAFDQTWSLTGAAVAATGTRTVSFSVDASSHEGIVQVVYVVREKACSQIDLCIDGNPLNDHPSLPTVELSIDGEIVDDPPPQAPFSFSPPTRDATWDELATGQAHDIALRLVGGDPTAVDVGIIIYEAD